MLAWTSILQQVNKVQIKSITDPLFRYSALLFVVGAATSVLNVPSWVVIVLFSTAGLILFLGLFFFVYFSFKNPDYLRSESFQLKKQTIELLGDKENNSNPHVKELKFISSPFSQQRIGTNNKDFEIDE